MSTITPTLEPEFAELVCIHGEHADFCAECDCIRRLAEAATFGDYSESDGWKYRLDAEARGAVLMSTPDESGPTVGVGDSAYVLGGSKPIHRDPDNFDLDLERETCTTCWTVKASNGSCSC